MLYLDGLALAQLEMTNRVRKSLEIIANVLIIIAVNRQLLDSIRERGVVNVSNLVQAEYLYIGKRLELGEEGK